MKDFWKDRRILITGANGFLASWMVKNLAARGARITSLVFAPNPLSLFEQEDYQAKTKTVRGSVLDFELLKDLLKRDKIETIFHVGAQAICTIARKDPLATLDVNIKGTYHVLEAARQVAPEAQVVVASSDKAYGIHDKLPYREHFPLQGQFPYEVSKSCADLISTMYWRTYRLPVCVVRCGNLYGGGDSHFSRVIPATIRAAYLDQPPVVIENSTRDFLYVEDAARGYRVLAERMAEPGKQSIAGEAYNFGTETPRSVRQVITMITKAMGKAHLTPRVVRAADQGIPNQYLSYEKARELPWEPRVAFEDGLRRTIDWYCDYFARETPSPKMQSSIEQYQPDPAS